MSEFEPEAIEPVSMVAEPQPLAVDAAAYDVVDLSEPVTPGTLLEADS